MTWRRIIAPIVALAEYGLRRDEVDLEELRRLRVMTMLCMSLIVIGVPFVVQYWMLGVPWMSAAVLLTVAGGAGTIVWMRRGLSSRHAGIVGTCLMFILLLLSNWCSGGFYDPNFGWLYVVPMLASLFATTRVGWIFTGVIAVLTILFWAAPDLGIVVPNYIPAEQHHLQSLANRVSAVIAIGIVLGAVASQQRFARRLLEEANDELRHQISEREVMQQRLIQSERMASMGTLAAGVGHEINNPLTFVMGNLELIERELLAGNSEGIQRLLADAQHGARRVRDLVRDLKTFTKYKAEGAVPVNVGEIVNRVANMTQNEIRHRARLVVECEPDLVAVGNEGRIEQVVLNLLTNAAQAIPLGAADDNQVHVKVTADDEQVVIDVEDTGPGIDEDVRERVFEPFFTTKETGTGMGLSICRNIVEGMDGSISAIPRDGGGTVFRVTLPRSRQQAAPARAATAPIAKSAKDRAYRVLAIDDEPMILRVLRRALVDFDVTAVSDSQAALDAARGGGFDVVLCDLMMPNVSGPKLYEMMRELVPDLDQRIIFMSGGAFGSEAVTFVKQGGFDVIHKPLDLSELEEVIRVRASRAS